jgi:hypothetical protein
VNSSPANSPSTTAPPLWQWVVLSIVLVGLMAFAVAHAPPGWQRPGPTALWFAAASGVAVGAIAVVHRIKSRRLVFLVAFFVIAIATAGMTGERYRLYVNSLRAVYLGPTTPKNPHAPMEAASRGQVMQEMIEEFRAERRAIYEAKRPFRVFLAFRLEALGIATEPWPLVFWFGEIFLGGLVGAFAALQWHKWQIETRPGPG